MQENRSFDSYFGTYPGADGIPGLAGNPGPSRARRIRRPATCVASYHDTRDLNYGGPHDDAAADADIASGHDERLLAAGAGAMASHCNNPDDPKCVLVLATPDVMGYHDASEIPNYWAYADATTCSRTTCSSRRTRGACPSHLSLVSGWSAQCSISGDPMQLRQRRSRLRLRPGTAPARRAPTTPWTDLTYLLAPLQRQLALLHLGPAREPDCGTTRCSARRRRRRRRRRASGTRCPSSTRCARTASSATSSVDRASTRRAQAGTLPNVVVDRPDRGMSASIRRRSSRAGRATSRA